MFLKHKILNKCQVCKRQVIDLCIKPSIVPQHSQERQDGRNRREREVFLLLYASRSKCVSRSISRFSERHRLNKITSAWVVCYHLLA